MGKTQRDVTLFSYMLLEPKANVISLRSLRKRAREIWQRTNDERISALAVYSRGKALASPESLVNDSLLVVSQSICLSELFEPCSTSSNNFKRAPSLLFPYIGTSVKENCSNLFLLNRAKNLDPKIPVLSRKKTSYSNPKKIRIQKKNERKID